MLKKYTLMPLQAALNFAFSKDEEALHQLHQLNDKIFEIIIEPLELHFFMRIHEGVFLLEPSASKPANTVIRSSPLGFIRLSFLPASKARSLFNDKIKISGDVEIGLLLKQIIDNLDIDWESHIATFTGDAVAYQLGSWVKQGLDFKNKLIDSFRHATVDYLHDELRLIPSKDEIEDFYEDIDHLRIRIDRLEAKFNLLMNKDDTD